MKENIADTIKLVITNIMKYEQHDLGENTHLDDLGLNSMSFVQMIVDIEEEFEIEFPMEDLVANAFVTIADIERRVLELKK